MVTKIKGAGAIERDCNCNRKSRCCRGDSTRLLIGIGCIIAAFLLLLLCAPPWFVALLVAALFVLLGIWLVLKR